MVDILDIGLVCGKPVQSDGQHSQGLLEHFLECPSYRHHFADGFHLRTYLCCDIAEFLEIPSRVLENDIVQCGLEACLGDLGY